MLDPITSYTHTYGTLMRFCHDVWAYVSLSQNRSNLSEIRIRGGARPVANASRKDRD